MIYVNDRKICRKFSSAYLLPSIVWFGPVLWNGKYNLDNRDQAFSVQCGGDIITLEYIRKKTTFRRYCSLSRIKLLFLVWQTLDSDYLAFFSVFMLRFCCHQWLSSLLCWPKSKLTLSQIFTSLALSMPHTMSLLFKTFSKHQN